MFDFENVIEQSKTACFHNVHALSNTLDIKTYLLSQFIQRVYTNNQSNKQSLLKYYCSIGILLSKCDWEMADVHKHPFHLSRLNLHYRELTSIVKGH